MIKRLVSIGCAAVVAAGLFGCSKASTPEPAAPVQPTETESAASQPSEAASSETAPSADVNGEGTLAAPEKVKVGIVSTSTPQAGGWTLSHYIGYEYLLEKMPELEVVWVDNVSDAGPDSEAMMERLVQEGCNMIISTSFGYQDAAVNIAQKYPEVYVMHCQGYLPPSENFTTYDIREFESTFLTGYLAGKMTKSNIVGYVGSQPVNTVIRATDGFALGVKKANPEAKVRLLWTNSWYDTTKEREAAQSLIDAGADVLGMFQSTPAVLQCAEENGAYGIGFHTDQSSFAPKATLTSYMWNWGPYYVDQVQKFQEGKAVGESVFLSITEGYGSLAPFNTEVIPAEIIAEVEDLQKKVASGEVKIFEGELKDNNGNVLVPAGEEMPLEAILKGDWLAENIEGNLQ